KPSPLTPFVATPRKATTPTPPRRAGLAPSPAHASLRADPLTHSFMIKLLRLLLVAPLVGGAPLLAQTSALTPGDTLVTYVVRPAYKSGDGRDIVLSSDAAGRAFF